MCGRFQLKPSEEVDALLQKLSASGPLAYSSDIAPGAPISIITGHEDRTARTATWWLLLDNSTLKPNYKYSSFNTRSDRLSDPKSIAYTPYRHSRCIIPASAFCEGLGDRKTYHMIELEDQAIAFGGLYKSYTNKETGEVVLAASIITLPPVEKWKTIHPKSIPLILDPDDTDTIGQWLDPDFSDVSAFNALLSPEIRLPQWVTPIGKPSTWNPVGASFPIT